MNQDIPPFHKTLSEHGLELQKGIVHTLQVNTGYLCNLSCRHCHLEAGPNRREVMSRETMAAVVAGAGRIPFTTIDITGGAPELVPDIAGLLDKLTPLAPRKLFRTNLLALRENMFLLDTLVAGGWSLIASLPAINESQVTSTRGKGVFSGSLEMLRRLNSAGYGRGQGLEIHLVSNPSGAFMPPAQNAAEKLFRRELSARQGILFDSLFVFANMPLGRFRAWLHASGNFQGYMRTLFDRFNPAVIAGLMCRTIVSVAWDGKIFDCDFNQAAKLPALGGTHIAELEAGTGGFEITTGDHCYACTAGSGFT